jgi:thioredoxin 2
MSASTNVVCPHCDAVNRVPSARLGEGPTCGRCKRSLFPGSPVVLTDDSFERHLVRSEIPLVVDFWAPWCGPCKMMAPSFEQAAATIEPRARLGKVNTEQNQMLAQRYGIRSIPTLAVFKDGQQVASQAGAMMLPQLVQWIESHL